MNQVKRAFGPNVPPDTTLLDRVTAAANAAARNAIQLADTRAILTGELIVPTSPSGGATKFSLTSLLSIAKRRRFVQPYGASDFFSSQDPPVKLVEAEVTRWWQPNLIVFRFKDVDGLKVTPQENTGGVWMPSTSPQVGGQYLTGTPTGAPIYWSVTPIKTEDFYVGGVIGGPQVPNAYEVEFARNTGGYMALRWQSMVAPYGQVTDHHVNAFKLPVTMIVNLTAT